MIKFHHKLTLVSDTVLCLPTREWERGTTATFPIEPVAKGYNLCTVAISQQIR